MKLWALFRTDQWHSKSSKEFLGVFSSFTSSEAALKKFGATQEQIKQTLYGGFNQSQSNNTEYEYEKVCVEVDCACLY